MATENWHTFGDGEGNTEDAWETLLTLLGETIAAISKPEAEKLLEAIKAFPNEAYPEFELDILVTLENAAKDAIKQ